MKLIFESWNKYIKEEQQKDYEKSYFGSNLNELGEKIYKAYLKFKKQYDESYEFPTYKEVAEFLKDPLINFAGDGSFRAVFFYGDKIVVKLAKMNSAKNMNKQDADLGKTGKYSNLFPKVYASDKDYSWIVMEQCETIRSPDRFLEFFQNKYVDQIMSDSAPHNKFILFGIMLTYQVDLLKQTNQEAAFEGMLRKTEARVYSPSMKKLIRYSEDASKIFKKILDGYGTAFQQLANVVAELGIASYEIRPHNVGVAPDGRFVIIDSSIQETIEHAFSVDDET